MSKDREFSWKKNLAFFVATSTALTLTILCKAGVWSQKIEGFTLTAPDSVSVQRGLCVHVACTFTYSGDGEPQIPAKELYAYWFKDKEQTTYLFYYRGDNKRGYVPGLLVATNDEKQYQDIDSSASGRFRLTGDPARGDCSFSINNAASVDQEMYYLRIEVGGSHFSYRIGYTRPRVVVTETHTGILSVLFGSETKGIIFLLGLYLIKACLCFLLFFFAFRFLNRRKTPPRKAPLTTSGL